MTPLIRTAAIVLAAGSGSRSGGPVAKQYRPMGGRTVLARSVANLLAHPGLATVTLVVPPGEEDQARAALGDLAESVGLVVGGESRRQSVANALESLAADASPPSHVLVHDGARPGLPSAVVDRLLACLGDGARAVIPVLAVVDTLVADQAGFSAGLIDRTTLRRVQTPQAFHFGTLLAAHRGWAGPDEPTDDAQMVRSGGADIVLVQGDARLDKITLPGDHERMERILDCAMTSRTGMGFDVHRLEPGAQLWLCGVNVPHSHGLSGHSDADVAIHALVDALLGALAEGDIGSHFPPSDPQWRGAGSDRFLAFAVERVAARGGVIDHVDLTIICEAPKIGPYRDVMRSRLADIMGLAPGRISVKATTTERLGLTGRREGIAAQALASVRLPADF